VNLAVVGHVEWVEFIRVERIPQPGEIVHALETWEEAAGGGAVAAVQLANLNGSAHLFTALGSDELGRRARQELEARGVTVHAAAPAEPQRRAFTYVDENGERTITVLGPKLLAPGDDASLPWEELPRCDAVYFVSGDVAAVRKARRSRMLVGAARDLPTLRRAEEELDVLVGSGNDPSERFEPGELRPSPRYVVTTSGSLGGWVRPGGPFRALPPPGPIADAYGCGDCFAAGMTYALAGGRSMEDAVALGARCGAAVLTGRGPYEGQLVGVQFDAPP
jgi:ribokinase